MNSANDVINCWGDSMMQGVGAGDAYIDLFDGMDILGSTTPSVLQEISDLKVYNNGVAGETSDEIMERAVSYYESDHPNEILVLEIGSNGGWNNNYQTLIKQYKRIIEAVNTKRYIIVGDTDDPGTSVGDAEQTRFLEDGSYVGVNSTDWEAALEEAFGEHFINMSRVWSWAIGVPSDLFFLSHIDTVSE